MTRLFPTATALAKADLNGLPLPKATTAAIKKLARAVVEREVDFSESTDSVLQALKTATGISQSTAEYVALRGSMAAVARVCRSTPMECL
jgi:3-methyladenine DNA glycosylase/8-oxoguanine DNA glycosylase